MMHAHEKSDSVIVAVKPANEAEQSAAERVEPRAETKGNAGQQSTCRAFQLPNGGDVFGSDRSPARTTPSRSSASRVGQA